MSTQTITEIEIAARKDAERIIAERKNETVEPGLVPEIDVNHLSKDQARKLMSAEHKALGYRPPPGSLAAQAQSVISKHEKEEVTGKITEDVARTIQSAEHKAMGHRPPPGSVSAQVQAAAAQNAQDGGNRTLDEIAPGLKEIAEGTPVTKDLANTLESVEHKALGYRPPHGSLAAQAQSVAAKNETDERSRTINDA
ncbi:hypothetical protein SISNIDRAFT_347572 [Sistotremastrum niveocremeum HHB9708]|uniref:SMP domain-containing protein n=1 Tax=Sistotremastrum niveocremeum HHB9708 TaxID=1314777 RepID=A0A164WVQ5_9AGAM|nr:hypothetical protein SISNIDRAFT_347572 [Sistotremastrum niveocremeum HHB9708]